MRYFVDCAKRCEWWMYASIAAAVLMIITK